ncbi:hypothetical protein N8T08_009719 [Aspergillus melleus]|uniref:Uncharacterized protein n=1 Tax=Aspergillus melleus TaxID=138277 RepID=A0ACC3AT26_9EURO|nr:hypothetical protein N8T08_009719 [Aspergillus melleus]
MTLLQLPNEILISIAKDLCCRQDITSFMTTNRHLYNLLKDLFQLYDIPEERHASILSCAASSGKTSIVSKILKDMLVARIKDHSLSDQPYYRPMDPTATFTEEELMIIGQFRMLRRGNKLWRAGYEADDILLIQDALNDAVIHGQMEVVQLLIESNVDLNFTYRRFTPLYLAVANDREELVDILLVGGAKCKSGICPLRIACQKGQRGMVRRLLEGAECSHLTIVASEAMRKNDVSVIRLLESLGVNMKLYSPAVKEAAAKKHDKYWGQRLAEVTDNNHITIQTTNYEALRLEALNPQPRAAQSLSST